MEDLMIKKLITLFKLGRKVAKSDILNIVNKFQEPPLAIKILFSILSFSFSQNKHQLWKTAAPKRIEQMSSIWAHFKELSLFFKMSSS